MTERFAGRPVEDPFDLAQPVGQHLLEVGEELGRSPAGLGLRAVQLGQRPGPGALDALLEAEDGRRGRLETRCLGVKGSHGCAVSHAARPGRNDGSTMGGH